MRISSLERSHSGLYKNIAPVKVYQKLIDTLLLMHKLEEESDSSEGEESNDSENIQEIKEVCFMSPLVN